MMIASFILAAALTAPPDTIAQRLPACTACHTRKDSSQAYFPRIHGKPAGYLYNQLQNFKTGRRINPQMSYFVQGLSDDYLREIAEYFAGEHLTPLPPAPAASSERARVLIVQGDKAAGVPACIACHGSSLTGVAPAVPGLLGLPPDYVIAQLGSWQQGARRALAPDCMASIARKLKPDEISAIARYLAAQTPPASAPPEKPLLRPLPLDCGSIP